MGRRTAELTHVCAVPGCGHLQPCPTHAPDPNAHRSDWRDREKQRWYRSALLLNWDGRCDRCGERFRADEVQAHHDRPGWDLEHGRLVCRPCHKAIEPAHAR